MAMIAAPITPARSPSLQGTIRRSRVASGSERQRAAEDSRKKLTVPANTSPSVRRTSRTIRIAPAWPTRTSRTTFLTGVGGSQDAMKQIKAGGLYRATFLDNPNMAGTAVNMARLIALGQGFSELVPPEVPRQVVVPAAVVTKDNVSEYEKYAFN